MRRVYYGMVTLIDAEIGKILDFLMSAVWRTTRYWFSPAITVITRAITG